jgi:hypothetical protein
MPGDCWPTAEQTLLLQAALLDGEAARRALESWRSRVDLDHLDRGSLRLLPMLYPRLLHADDGDPLMTRVRAAHDRAVVRNTALVDMTTGVVGLFRHAGIDSVVLKGMALIARGYASPGSRPMADCDLLVPERDVLAARDVLLGQGWRMEGRLDAEYLSLRHGVTFRAPSGSQLDLHWHVLADCCEKGADAEFWHAAEPAVLNGVPTKTLSAADMVLHACVHGVRWSIIPPARWAADALVVIRAASPAVAWERVVDQTERRVEVLPMRETLRYLTDVLAAPVPEWVHTRLSRATVPRWAHAEYRVKMRRRTRWRQVLFHWFQHRRHARAHTLVGAAVRFPWYLRRRFRAATAGAPHA